MLKVNPFLPNYNGMGITMDNFTSYNSIVAQVIANYLNTLKKANRLDLFKIDGLNQYIKDCLMNEQYITNQANYEGIEPLDLKDIYIILSKVTERNFKMDDFMAFINNKVVDKYKNQRRVTDQKYYFDQAIKTTNAKNPANTKVAIKQYLRGNPSYFTRNEHARQGLIKYAPSYNVINIMRTELSKNNIPIPHTDDKLIDAYLNKVNSNINNQTNKGDYYFDIIKNAYINTLKEYNRAQSRAAMIKMLTNGNIRYFTNCHGDRDKLSSILNKDIKRIILSNINIGDLNFDNVLEIVDRFEEAISVNLYDKYDNNEININK